MNKKLVMLLILDGFGINEIENGNAVRLAHTPNLDRLFSESSHSVLDASGLSVGLPEGQMGNSEVGHQSLGAGRILYQDLVKINKSILDESFYEIKEFNDAIDNAIENNTNLHLIGLLSDGGVHSCINHLYALLTLCKKRNFERVYVHAFLDGRDTAPKSAIKYLEELESKINEIGVGKIATLSGRYYSMDRDNRWERIKKTYDALVNGEGIKEKNVVDAINKSYENDVTDEFIIPTVITENDSEVALINENDSVIFYNFRSDRAREITRALVDNDFKEFEVKKLNLNFVCMTEYDSTMPNVNVAFKPDNLKNTFGEYISSLGLKQLRIAETEKYPHVTFFFNGGREIEFEGEDRVLIPSPKVSTYDLKPEMSTFEITDKVLEAIKSKKYQSIIMNIACTDMVGHTGKLDAAIKAVEAADTSIGKIINEIDKVNGVLLITADHGNCETMINYETNEPHTAHTTNLVPFIMYNNNSFSLKNGTLSNVAPTMLDILDIKKPIEMTSESLIIK